MQVYSMCIVMSRTAINCHLHFFTLLISTCIINARVKCWLLCKARLRWLHMVDLVVACGCERSIILV